MEIIEWRKPRRRIDRASSDEFFRNALPEMTLFRFRTRNFRVAPHGGEFSIKTLLFGRETYDFGTRRVHLAPGRMLLVNAGQEYASSIREDTESLSIFFCRDELISAVAYATRDADHLLDDPRHASAGAMLDVPQIAYDKPRGVRMGFERRANALGRADAVAAEDAAREFLVESLIHAFSLTPPRTLAHVRKRSTRDELLARVLRARRLIDDTGGRACTLDRLASTACMSKYHFLRIFRDAFGVTPGVYARDRRLETACRALADGATTIEAARRAGFGCARSLVRAHTNVFGKPPSVTLDN